MTMNIQNIAEHGVGVTLMVSQWGGRRKLRASDLGEGVHLPPDQLASLGSKKICDPTELRPFKKLKARAENLLKKNGVSNIVARGCWVIPMAKAEGVIGELRQIKELFNKEKARFLASYDAKLEDWLTMNEEWRDIIENSLMSKEEVGWKLGFHFHAFTFGNTNVPGLDDELTQKLEGLTGRLFVEVAGTAKDLYESSFEGKTKVTQRALSPVKTLREKLKGFENFTPLVAPVVEDIDNVLSMAPKNGPIENGPFTALQGLLHMLKKPAPAMEYAERKLAGMVEEDPFGLEEIQGETTSGENSNSEKAQHQPTLLHESEMDSEKGQEPLVCEDEAPVFDEDFEDEEAAEVAELAPVTEEASLETHEPEILPVEELDEENEEEVTPLTFDDIDESNLYGGYEPANDATVTAFSSMEMEDEESLSFASDISSADLPKFVPGEW